MVTARARRTPLLRGRPREGRTPLRKRLVPYGLLAPGAAWLVVLFVVPVGIMVHTSLQSGGLLAGGFRFTWEWGNYLQGVADNRRYFLRSIGYSGIVTGSALVLAYPLAYWIAFRGGRWKSSLLLLVLLPFFVSFTIRTVQWRFILGDDGIVLGPLKDLGIVGPDFHVLATPLAVIAGIAYNFLPFTTFPLYVALERIDRSLVEAAEDLYASPARAFWKVVFPLSLPGVFAAVILTFVPAMGDYLNAELLGNPDTTMIGNVIQRKFLTTLDYPEAAALSIVLMVGMVILASGYARVLGTEDGAIVGVGPTPAGRAARPRALRAPLIGRLRRRAARMAVPAYGALMILYLTSPVFLMVLYSFNDVAQERQTVRFWGFTLHWWKNLFDVPGLTAALQHSIAVAVPSTLVATALGVLLGLALGRYRFGARGVTNFVIFLAIAVPEIVLGSSLLSLFVATGAVPLGYWTTLLAHVSFSVPFVAVVVRARVQGMDRALEDAALDLFAPPATAFAKVTLPLIMPGVLAGGLLAFVLSLDDFVITNFVAGPFETFPLWVYGATRIGLPPQVNVMGTLLFLAGLLLAVLNVVLRPSRA